MGGGGDIILYLIIWYSYNRQFFSTTKLFKYPDK